MPGTGVCERQPAVLVPGYTGSKEDFLAILHQLGAAGRRVIALDLRGQYQTPGPNEPGAYAITELGADVAAVIDAVAARVSAGGAAGSDGHAPAQAWPDGGNCGGVHLLGHSFGGLVVRETVLAGLTGIASLTLMSSGPAGLTGPARAETARLLARLDDPGPEPMGRIIERVWDAEMAPLASARGVDPVVAAFLRERMLCNSPVGLRVMGEYLLSAPDRVAELARHVEVPVLVLYGEDDDKWDAEAQEEMAARLAAERVCIPGAAHSPAVEAPETTASALNAFWHTAEVAADGRGRAAGRKARPGSRPLADPPGRHGASSSMPSQGRHG